MANKVEAPSNIPRNAHYIVCPKQNKNIYHLQNQRNIGNFMSLCDKILIKERKKNRKKKERKKESKKARNK
jgi:hypothetical protein